MHYLTILLIKLTFPSFPTKHYQLCSSVNVYCTELLFYLYVGAVPYKERVVCTHMCGYL